MENGGSKQLETQLAKIKRELRRKERKLKKFSQVLGAKQHVWETLQRQRMASEEQSGSGNEEGEDSPDLQFKSNISRTVTFSAEEPEVIFVTPTPCLESKRKDKNHRYYRSLSTRKRSSPENCNERKQRYNEVEASLEILYESKSNHDRDKPNSISNNCIHSPKYCNSSPPGEDKCFFSESFVSDSIEAVSLPGESFTGTEGIKPAESKEVSQQFETQDIETMSLSPSPTLIIKRDKKHAILNMPSTSPSRDDQAQLEPLTPVHHSPTSNSASELIETKKLLVTSDIPPEKKEQCVGYTCINNLSSNLTIANQASLNMIDGERSEADIQVFKRVDEIASGCHAKEEHRHEKKKPGNVRREQSQDLFGTQYMPAKEVEVSRKVLSHREWRQHRTSQSTSSESSTSGVATVIQGKTYGWKCKGDADKKKDGFHVSDIEPHKQQEERVDKCKDDILNEELMIKEMENEVMKDATNSEEIANEVDITLKSTVKENLYEMSLDLYEEENEEQIVFDIEKKLTPVIEGSPQKCFENSNETINLVSNEKTMREEDLFKNNCSISIPCQRNVLTKDKSDLLKYSKVTRIESSEQDNEVGLDIVSVDRSISCSEYINSRSIWECRKRKTYNPKKLKDTDSDDENLNASRAKTLASQVTDETIATISPNIFPASITSAPQWSVTYEEVVAIKDYGRVLTTSLVSTPHSEEVQPCILIVQEMGLSLWKKEKVWEAAGSEAYTVGNSSDIRNITAVGLKSSDEARFIVVFSSISRDGLLILYAQFSQQESKWLITKTDFNTSMWSSPKTPICCALDDWTIAFFSTHQEPSSQLLIVDFDVTYSTRRKVWDLVCRPYTRTLLQNVYLNSLAPLNQPDAAGILLCTSSTNLYLIDVLENITVTKLPLQELTPFWAIALRDLIFMLSTDKKSSQLYLTALNPITGDQEQFFSWSHDNNERLHCRSSGSSALEVCDSREPTGVSLQPRALCIVFSDGKIMNISFDSSTIVSENSKCCPSPINKCS